MALEKQKTYKKVFDLACEELLASDLVANFRNAHVECTIDDGHYEVTVPFFEEHIIIDFHGPAYGTLAPCVVRGNLSSEQSSREGEAPAALQMEGATRAPGIETPGFSFRSSEGSNVTLATRILILHYLLKSSGEPLREDKIPYEDIPGCRPYLPVFERRVVHPLLSAFGYNRDLFRSAGDSLAGVPESFGDASFTLNAFPMIPLTFILWEGDQEFPPSLKVLFDPSIDTYLPLEDITVLSKLAAVRITKAARKAYTAEL